MSPIRELRAVMNVLDKWQGYPDTAITPADKVAWLISLLRITLRRLQREEKNDQQKPVRWADSETVAEPVRPKE